MSYFSSQHTNPASYLPHSADPTPKVDKLREGLDESMSDKYIVVPLSQLLAFLDDVDVDTFGLMPECDFSHVPTSGLEKDMYQPLCDVINESGICPGIRFVETSGGQHVGDKSQQKIDAGGYPTQHAPQPHGHVDWGRIVFSAEIKPQWENRDPFDDGEVPVPEAKERAQVRGQLLSYTSLAFLYGQRTFHFTLLVLGKYARLIRWDRAGAVVSTRFLYQSDMDFRRFLWRFGHASDEQRGLDPTAVVLEKDDPDYDLMDKYANEKLEIGDYARELFAKTLNKGWLRWRVTVGRGRKARQFLISKPHFHTPELVGRGTRGSIALDKKECKDEKKRFAYVKDAWRVISTGHKEGAPPEEKQLREGDILRILDKHKVPFVPSVLCDGDVKKQRTRSHEHWKGDKCPMRIHRHYRMAVEQIGLPLSEFRRGLELVIALAQCLQAHEDAYLKAKISHRDVSSGNLLLLPVETVNPDGTHKVVYRGMLNDWELSRMVKELEDGVPADRTGTWQFMSVRCSDDPFAPIMVDDELESFYNVLLYYAARYLHSNCEDVFGFMRQYFDAYDRRLNVTYTSNYKKLCVELGSIDLPGTKTSLVFHRAEDCDPSTSPHPINQILQEMGSWLKARYALARALSATTPAGEEDVTVPADDMKDEYNLLYDEGEDPTPDPLESTVGEKKLPEADTALLTEIAANLKTHRPLKMLLHKVINKNVWPTNDTVPDRLGLKLDKEKILREVAAKVAAENAANYPPSDTTSKPSDTAIEPLGTSTGSSGTGEPSSIQTQKSSGNKRSGGHLDEDIADEESAPKRGRTD